MLKAFLKSSPFRKPVVGVFRDAGCLLPDSQPRLLKLVSHLQAQLCPEQECQANLRVTCKAKEEADHGIEDRLIREDQVVHAVGGARRIALE